MSATHEYSLHYLINELMKTLNVSKSNSIGPELIVELLAKHKGRNIYPSSEIEDAKRKLLNNSSTPKEFNELYDDLKARHVQDLDNTLIILSQIADNQEVQELIKPNSGSTFPTSRSMSILTPQRFHNDTPGQHTFVPSMNTTRRTDTILSSPSSTFKHSPGVLAELKENLLRPSSTQPSLSIPSEIYQKFHKENIDTRRRGDYPQRPPWFTERLGLVWDFYPTPQKFEPDVALGRSTIVEQEKIIVEDLLLCMLGIEGKFIKTPSLSLTDKQAERSFHIDRSLDPTLRDLARRMLPLCSSHSLIVRFIEERIQFKYGLVNHALAGALRGVLERFYVFVGQLETQQNLGNLTLQTLWFHTEPVMHIMEVVAIIVRTINKGNNIGRSVLDLLHEQTQNSSGYKQTYDTCYYLAKSAFKPYLTMLETWIYKGIIHDPYNEFMVTENKDVQKENLENDFNDKYWGKRYVLNRNNTPRLLESMSEMILNTGKYLNAIRESGIDDKTKTMEELKYTTKEKDLEEPLEKAYQYASQILLNLVLNEYHLLERFKTLKHYFLIDQGDYIVQFMDIAEDELNKSASIINAEKIDALLVVALGTSIDPYKDDLRIKLFNYDLISMLEKVITIDRVSGGGGNSSLSSSSSSVSLYAQGDFASTPKTSDPIEIKLSGLESFSLDYDVKWPISLIINRFVLVRYQMLFRYLFYVKHIERLLCNVWRFHKNGRKLTTRQQQKTTSSTTARKTNVGDAAAYLRHKMLHFVQNLLYYMSFEVIEPHWHTFQTNLKKVTNIDELLKYHFLFLDNCLRDCMLTNGHLLRLIHKLMAICVLFANTMMKVDEPIPFSSTTTTKTNLPTSEESLFAMIYNFNSNFTNQLTALLDAISREDGGVHGQEHRLTNIIHRINFNNQYHFHGGM